MFKYIDLHITLTMSNEVAKSKVNTCEESLVRCVFENVYLFWYIMQFIPKECEKVRLYQLTAVTYSNLQLHRITSPIGGSLLRTIRRDYLGIFKNVTLTPTDTDDATLLPNIRPDILCLTANANNNVPDDSELLPDIVPDTNDEWETADLSHMKNLRHIIFKHKIQTTIIQKTHLQLSIIEFQDVKIVFILDVMTLPALKELQVTNCRDIPIFENISRLQKLIIKCSNISICCDKPTIDNTVQNQLSHLEITKSTICGIGIKRLCSMINHDSSDILIMFGCAKKCNVIDKSIQYKVCYTHPNNAIRNHNYFICIARPDVFSYSTGSYAQNEKKQRIHFFDQFERRVGIWCYDESISFPKDMTSFIPSLPFDFTKLKNYPFLDTVFTKFDNPKRLENFWNLKRLIFGGEFNQQLEILPSSLEILYFHGQYNQPLPQLPNTLQSLSLSDAYNMPLPRLPDGLQFLRIGTNFDQELSYLPESLKQIRVASGNKYQCKCTLPKNVKVILE